MAFGQKLRYITDQNGPRVGSGEKGPSKNMKKKIKNFQLSNLSQPVFLLENPTHWGLETAVCPIFVKPILDVSAVCSLVPSMNLSHTQHNYLCPKNPSYVLEKTDSRFFLRLKATIKTTIFSNFYVTDNFSSCYSRNSCKEKYRLFQ